MCGYFFYLPIDSLEYLAPLGAQSYRCAVTWTSLGCLRLKGEILSIKLFLALLRTLDTLCFLV